ncbi:hypothetical protein [Streptomyces sp. NPDC096142]|uniref:hypothetical protein n=1 Tax=Streptomyces sp. NPDC096142 TaxID=3366077 RepID=UPI00382701F8
MNWTTRSTCKGRGGGESLTAKPLAHRRVVDQQRQEAAQGLLRGVVLQQLLGCVAQVVD